MSQKIDSINAEPLAGRATAGVTPSGASGRTRDAVPAAPATDSVMLTGAAVSLQRLERALQGGTAFDAAKVESVRSALAAGTYKINSPAIAGKLVELERMLARQG